MKSKDAGGSTYENDQNVRFALCADRSVKAPYIFIHRPIRIPIEDVIY